MSTKFKPGDQVKFNPEEIKRWERENQWYRNYPFTLKDTFTIKYWNGYLFKITFKDDPTEYGFHDFNLELAGPPLTQQDKIIQKIKYLNKQFSERKHATIQDW